MRGQPDPRTASLPIVALTAFASLQERERALARGFEEYLTKPVEPGRLARILADLLRQRTIGGA